MDVNMYVDHVSPNGDRLYASRGVATILNVGRNNMLKALKQKGVFDMQNTPTKGYRDTNLFIVKRREVRGGRITYVTYYTKKGLELVDQVTSHLPRKKRHVEKKLNHDLLTILNQG